jgi:hypothetical protein
MYLPKTRNFLSLSLSLSFTHIHTHTHTHTHTPHPSAHLVAKTVIARSFQGYRALFSMPLGRGSQVGAVRQGLNAHFANEKPGSQRLLD